MRILSYNILLQTGFTLPRKILIKWHQVELIIEGSRQKNKSQWLTVFLALREHSEPQKFTQGTFHKLLERLTPEPCESVIFEYVCSGKTLCNFIPNAKFCSDEVNQVICLTIVSALDT